MIKTNQTSAKCLNSTLATWWQLKLTVAVALLVVWPAELSAQESKPQAFPGFRHVDQANAAIETSSGETLVLLADQDFAPWSFRDAEGRLQGLAVDIAQLACEEAGIKCDIKPAAYANLLQSLESGAAQGIVSGPKLDENLAAKFSLTRPYFQTLGRFAVRAGSPLSTPDVRSLAGRRIGFRGNSAHARFLETYYARSALVPFDTQALLLEGLRTGQVDVVFGDAVQLAFWLQGSASRGCCNFLGKAFVDRASFTRSLSFILRRDAADARVKLDAGLDRLELSGKTADVFSKYLPASLW
jgi:polar amino acid transport system substrate-binding protein